MNSALKNPARAKLGAQFTRNQLSVHGKSPPREDGCTARERKRGRRSPDLLFTNILKLGYGVYTKMRQNTEGSKEEKVGDDAPQLELEEDQPPGEVQLEGRHQLQRASSRHAYGNGYVGACDRRDRKVPSAQRHTRVGRDRPRLRLAVEEIQAYFNSAFAASTPRMASASKEIRRVRGSKGAGATRGGVGRRPPALLARRPATPPTTRSERLARGATAVQNSNA